MVRPSGSIPLPTQGQRAELIIKGPVVMFSAFLFFVLAASKDTTHITYPPFSFESQEACIRHLPEYKEHMIRQLNLKPDQVIFTFVGCFYKPVTDL